MVGVGGRKRTHGHGAEGLIVPLGEDHRRLGALLDQLGPDTGFDSIGDFAQTRAAIEASGAEIVTVAIRRTNIGQAKGEPSLLEFLPSSKFTYLPNTAGCYNADDAVRTLRLARDADAAVARRREAAVDGVARPAAGIR